MNNIISYRPQKSVCGSEQSLSDVDDRDQEIENESSSSFGELRLSLKRYVNLYGVVQQIEAHVHSEEENLTTKKNKENSN